jgi:hypothetical protein
MRERFKGHVDTWVESTDPLKHVFEVSWRLWRSYPPFNDLIRTSASPHS